MRLSDLNPRFVNAGGPGIFNADGSPAEARVGIGLIFDCPCGKDPETHWRYVDFENPIDGKPPHDNRPSLPKWRRIGDNLESLTLEPSILSDPRKGGCGWHGWIRNGEIINA